MFLLDGRALKERDSHTARRGHCMPQEINKAMIHQVVQLLLRKEPDPRTGMILEDCFDRGKGVGFVHQGMYRPFTSTVLVQI